jgi:hypothetical protein
VRKACGIPDLIRKVAIAFDSLVGELDIPPRRGHGGEREAQGIRAELLHDMKRIDYIAF